MRLMLLACLCALACTSAFAFDGLPRRGSLGVGLRAVPQDLLEKYHLQPRAAIQVVAGPDGKLNGDLKEGDIIVEIAGKALTSFPEMNEIFRNQKVGSEVTLKVLSDGKPATRHVPFLEKPRDRGENYDVLYDDVVSYGHRIRTIVTKPKSPGKHPVLFWIQGINASTVDYPLTSSNINVKILKAFNDDGYVTIRVEKPGVGDSEGGPAMTVAFDEETDIYRQALKALDKYDFVDRGRVYMFGHSMGGCHAPILAAELPVKGIITYGTVSGSWLEWHIKAARSQAILAGMDPIEVDKRVRQTVEFYSALYNDKKPIAQIRKEHPELADYIKGEAPTDDMMSVRSVRYMVELNDKNFSDYWSRIGEARVLALFGENDFVSLKDDQVQIPPFVNGKHPGRATYREVAGSDHIFSKTTSMADSLKTFGQPSNVFNPEVIKVMKEWIAEFEKG
jgi:pimeloyl-ACP methyl ester carboxylesterase